MKIKLIDKKKAHRADKILLILFVVMFLTMAITCINICKYPEFYSTTWRYQLENDIKAGDLEAINYYNENYPQNGKQLYK